MNKPWMPLYVADYVADTAHLNAAQSGAYLHLIMHYWQTGGLPDDDNALARIARMTGSEWKRARSIVAPFFHDGWKHKRIDAELAHAEQVSSKRRAAAEQRHSNSSANADAFADANAPANAEQMDTHARASSQSQRKEDAASAAPPDPEHDLFRRGKEVCGPDAGGLIAKLLKAKKRNIPLARAAIEQASTKQNPREYLGAVIAGGNASEDGRRLSNDEQFFGAGKIPGVI